MRSLRSRILGLKNSTTQKSKSGKLNRGRTLLVLTALESRLNPSQFYGPMQADTLHQINRLGLDAFSIRAEIPESSTGASTYFDLSNYTAFSIDTNRLLNHLSGDVVLDGADVQLAIPRPDGTYQQFRVWEYQLMDDDLAALRPDIKTYRGIAADDPTASLVADITPHGFRAQVLSPNGAYYIDPYYHLDNSIFVSYFKSDYQHKKGDGCLCENCTQVLSGGGISPQGPGGGIEPQGPNINNGQTLRRYRLAVAATGEYTQFWGGTVSNAQAGMLTTINRVAGIYERDFAVTFTYVNNTTIIYTDPATDPYTNNSGSTMLGQNQTNLDNVIGNANYDVGHVLSTGGGGVASLAVVGKTGSKARGVTGSSNPTGDPFDVDYVAHELGHQFGANHTFNASNGNRNASTAYEPGSGSTIMSYAGIIAGNNVQNNSDPYFHAVSIGEVIGYLNTIPSVGILTSSGNTPPVANAGASFAIPANTPFALTGSATDVNGDPITYTWEQYDLGPATSLGTYSSTAPLFRTITGTANPTRTFPMLNNLLNNTSSVNEVMPIEARTLNFTLTARDTRALGGLFGPVVGGVGMSDMKVTVASSPGFRVTSPNTAVSWTGGSAQTITWEVAGTSAAPVNTSSVNILLSTDGGLTFPHVLVSNTPNDGSETVVLPNLPTSKARIRVQPVDNIYFDISDANFTITPGSPMQVTSTSPTIGSVITGPTTTLDVTFSENINAATLQASDLSVSMGSVAGVVLQSPNTARFTITGLNGEGTLSVSMPAGAVTSTVGNTSSSFAANYSLDVDVVPFTAAFAAVQPLGSRVYSATQPGFSINVPGDTDSFTLAIDAGQTLSAIVDPAASLAARITMTGPGANHNSTGFAGKPVALTSVPVVGGTYTFTVEGVSSSSGAYSLQILLNAAPEFESIGGTGNDTTATAQNLNPAFLSIGGNASMASVLGTLGGSAGAVEIEPNNSIATATNVAATFSTYTGNLYHIGITGAMDSGTDSDYFNIGTLDNGDIITITQSGLDSSRGTQPDPLVRLYRGTTQVTNNDDGGPGLDSLIFRQQISTTGTHYIRAHQFTGSGGAAGTYQLAALLENTGALPLTGGTLVSETEPNDSVAAANNASSSWRPVQFISTVSGALSSASDVDTFSYTFNTGDLITINARSTGSAVLRTRILNAVGTVVALDDGTSSNNGGPGNNSPIYGYRVPAGGTYYVEVQGSTAGTYELDVLLSSTTPPPSPDDHYSFTLEAGDQLDLGLTSASAGTFVLDLLNSGGTILASGTGGSSNLSRTISGFIAPSAGTYYARLNGSNASTYLFTAIKNATFDREPNNTFAAAQPMATNATAIGAISGDDDWFSINLTAGNTYTFTTNTPGDGSGVFVNGLDPRLELYTPGNTFIAGDSNSAPDARNAVLAVPITSTGEYRLRVMADAGSGEYQVNVASASSTPGVSGFIVNNGAAQRSRVTTLTVNFTQPVDVATLTSPGGITLTRTSALNSGAVGTVVQAGATGGNGNILLSPANGNVTTVTLTFDNANGIESSSGVENGSLSDGYWQLAIPSLGYSSALGDFELRRLFGDNNNDGTVDSIDFSGFGSTFGLSSGTGNFNAAFDFTGDGTIDAADFAQFGSRFGISL